VSPGLRRVSVRVPAAEAEVARARFLVLAPAGFEEIEFDGELELAVYTDDAGAEPIRSSFGSALVAHVEPGWEEQWRAFHRGVRAGGLWIGPPWEEPPPGTPSVVVEPGRAFGTGAHATTRACIELLAGMPRGSLLDAGCGSGVLAIAAARLGFAPVIAVDVDPVAVDVARENALRNQVRVETQLLDVLRDVLPHADVAVVNIELGSVDRVLDRCGAPHLVTSGYLAHESPQAPGRRRAARLEIEGWAADRFELEQSQDDGRCTGSTSTR
jgi:ribosomal protein L11 methyltransferase